MLLWSHDPLTTVESWCASSKEQLYLGCGVSLFVCCVAVGKGRNSLEGRVTTVGVSDY